MDNVKERGMFSPSHAVWKFAYAGDELSDWTGYAEELVQKWRTQSSDEVVFKDTFQIILASLLLQDDLLPSSARITFAEIMLETIAEASAGKLSINCLHIAPPMPGRKKNPSETYIRFHAVKALIEGGASATEAYREIAEKHFKSPDTIRREYERVIKKIRKRKETGKNDH